MAAIQHDPVYDLAAYDFSLMLQSVKQTDKQFINGLRPPLEISAFSVIMEKITQNYEQDSEKNRVAAR